MRTEFCFPMHHCKRAGINKPSIHKNAETLILIVFMKVYCIILSKLNPLSKNCGILALVG